MLDAFREDPRGTLAGMIERRQAQNPAYRPPRVLKVLTWAFLDDRNRRVMSRLALRVLRARS
jgi:hypothetical protein